MFRAAIVKMESIQLAAEYLMNVRDKPTVAGRKLRLNPDTRDRHRRHESKPLKIYDGESEIGQEYVEWNKALGYIILKNKMYKIYYAIKFLFAFKYIEFHYYIIIPYC